MIKPWLLLVLLTWPGMAWSDGMRCQKDGGSVIVSSGDSKARVVAACGEPEAKEVTALVTQGVRRGPWYQEVTIPMERWTYACGYGQFDKILTFQGDALVKVVSGNKDIQGGPARCF